MASASEVLGYLPPYWEDQLSPGPQREPAPGIRPIDDSSPSAGSIARGGGLAPEARLQEEQTVHDKYPFADGDPDGSWAKLVSRLQTGDTTAMAELYHVFSKGIRFYLCRQVGTQELDDRVHDAFLIVVQSIQRGELRDPRRLMGFVRTVVRRMVAAQIDRDIQTRKENLDVDFNDHVADQRANPEKSIMLRQKIDLIKQILDKMPDRDQEILRRFYVEEQHPERICDEMKLSVTQFRLLKNRAKSRFGELGKESCAKHRKL